MLMTQHTADLLTVAELARELRVSEPTVYRRIHDGSIVAVRLGACGPLRIPRDSLETFLQPAARPRLIAGPPTSTRRPT
jgi:excisionase family DNA binding protein